jgi:hypothetical protein
VLLVAITTAHPRFRPQFRVGGVGGTPNFKVTLGVTQFVSTPVTPDGIVTLCGARRFSHLECYDIGNPATISRSWWDTPTRGSVTSATCQGALASPAVRPKETW